MILEAAQLGEILPGGIKAIRHGSERILLCNVDGQYHAVSEQCGHMKASLVPGALYKHILTCPLHKAQFDVTTGKALSGPVPPPPWRPQPKASSDYMGYEAMEMVQIKTHDLTTYAVRVEGDRVLVEV
ncbi:MAG: Rieske 2Fe-2S domain-containing protein [bacterium]|nr:Rieske 2Fe-2S domain-containing protein [bacterium]